MSVLSQSLLCWSLLMLQADLAISSFGDPSLRPRVGSDVCFRLLQSARCVPHSSSELCCASSFHPRSSLCLNFPILSLITLPLTPSNLISELPPVLSLYPTSFDPPSTCLYPYPAQTLCLYLHPMLDPLPVPPSHPDMTCTTISPQSLFLSHPGPDSLSCSCLVRSQAPH